MGALLSIGRFAKLTGLSVRALRFYDASGLLRPSVVDPETGYRYYRFLQLTQAQTIRTLRELDVPLDDIARVLERADLRPVLEGHVRTLRDEHARLGERLARTEGLLRDAAALHAGGVGLRTEPGTHTVTRRVHTALERAEGDRARTAARLFEDAVELNLTVTGAVRLAWLPECRFDPENYEVALHLPVTTPCPDAARAGWLEGTRVAHTTHTGAYADLHRAYSDVDAWLEGQGLAQCGPAQEVYLRAPWDDVPPTDWLTELLVPVGAVGD
jgi:DNA-binding transcriptional MerR regulator